jgi:[protein-PII] uridylyltransferase
MVLIQEGRPEEALAICDQQLAANPDLHEARLNRAMAMLKLGRFAEAIHTPVGELENTGFGALTGDLAVKPLANRLLCDVADVGLDLGHSVRTPAQACQQARLDATICTSLIESRFLAGSVGLYSRFTNRFQKQTNRRWASLVLTIEESRQQERSQYGETVYLLEPNVKRTRGGLRDIQLVRWLGFARHGVADPEALQLVGAISKSDQNDLRAASEFLLRLRLSLRDTLGFSTQDGMVLCERGAGGPT